ncbi:MAG: hypothetical protein WC074_00010 [bacterium]|jgi:hypothetical protein
MMLRFCKNILYLMAVVLVTAGTAEAETPFVRQPSGEAKIALFETCQSYPRLNGRLLDTYSLKFDYFEIAAMADISLEGYRVVVIGESWLRNLDMSALKKSRAKIEKYLVGGGRIAAFRNGLDPNAWLPQELKVKRGTRELRMPVILRKEHPVFNVRHSIAENKFGFYDPPLKHPISSLKALCWGGSIINPFINLSPVWTPLVMGTVEKEGLFESGYKGYALVEASYGSRGGKVLLCEMIPVFSAVERRSDTGKAFMENILAYLCDE